MSSTGTGEDGVEGDGLPRYMAMHGLLASLLLGAEALDDDDEDGEEGLGQGKMKAESREEEGQSDQQHMNHKSAGTVAVTASGADGVEEAMGSA